MTDDIRATGVQRFHRQPDPWDAVRLTGDANWDAIAAWCDGQVERLFDAKGDEPRRRLGVPRSESSFYAYEGDWILHSVDPEYDVFLVLSDGEFFDQYELTGLRPHPDRYREAIEFLENPADSHDAISVVQGLVAEIDRLAGSGEVSDGSA